jgi:WD40 repeat protein
MSYQKETLKYKKSLILNLSEITKKYQKKSRTPKNIQKIKTFNDVSLAKHPSINYFDEDNWKKRFFAENIGKITSISVSKSDKFIAFGSEDSTVRVFNLLTKMMELTLIGHLGKVLSVEISNSEKFVISGSDDNTIRVWDLNSGSNLKILKNCKEKVKWLCLSGDDKYLVSSGGDDKGFIWKLEENSIIYKLEKINTYVKPVFKDLETLLYIDGSLLIFLKILTFQRIPFYANYPINGLSLCSNNKNALISSSCTKTFLQINSENQKVIGSIEFNPIIMKNGLIQLGYISKIDKIFISDLVSKINIIDPKNDPSKGIYLHHPHTSIIQSSNSEIIYFSTKNTLELYNITKNHFESITKFTYFDVDISIMSHDNSLLLYPSFENKVSVFNIELEQMACELPGQSCEVTSIAISKTNSKIVLTYSNGDLNVWNLRDVSLISSFSSELKIFTCICFSHQENFLAFSSNDNSVTLLELPYCIIVGKFDICLSTVKSLCFNNDDLLLLIGEVNGCARGFNFYEKDQVFLLCGAKNGALLVTASDNGRVVLVGDGNGILRVWDRDQAKMVARVTDLQESLQWIKKFQEFRTVFENFFTEIL